MKRFSFFLVTAMVMAPAALRAQDAAVEERLNKLSAQIEDLIVAKDAQNKRIEELAKAIRELQEQQNKPNATYASQDDLRQLARSLQEVDQKRRDDNETVVKKLEDLRKALSAPVKPAAPSRPRVSGDDGAPAAQEKGFEYVIKSGDTFSAIAKACQDQGIKVTSEQIQKANPDVKPESMPVGKKIFIPAPKQ